MGNYYDDTRRLENIINRLIRSLVMGANQYKVKERLHRARAALAHREKIEEEENERESEAEAAANTG